jgi:hypothetical protein
MVQKWENDGFSIGVNDSMELGKKYGAQLGIIHVLELALMALFEKIINNGMKMGEFGVIDEHVKNGMFFISFKT